MLFQADGRFEALRALGLTEYQARAYVALCRLGRATATQLSRAAGVPRNKMYHTLEELGALGLAELRLGEVQTFAPLPLAGFLRDRARMHQEALADLERRQPALEEMFALRPEQPQPGPLLSCRVVHGRPAALARVLEALEGAERSVLAMGGAMAARSLGRGALGQALEAKAREGLEVRVVVPFLPGTEDAARALRGRVGDGARVTDQGRDGGLTLVADDRVAVHLAEGAREGDDVCLVSESAIVGHMLAQAARSLWWLALPVPAEGAGLPGIARPATSYADFLPEAARGVAEAREEVLACTAGFFAPTAERDYAEAVRAAVGRGVRVRLLTGSPARAAPWLGALADTGAEVRVLELPPPVGYAVFDRARAMVAVAPPAFQGNAWEPFGGLVVRDAPTAAAMAEAFERAWAASLPLPPVPAEAR